MPLFDFLKCFLTDLFRCAVDAEQPRKGHLWIRSFQAGDSSYNLRSFRSLSEGKTRITHSSIFFLQPRDLKSYPLFLCRTSLSLGSDNLLQTSVSGPG